MSLIKQKIENDEYYYNLAKHILKKIGAIRYCACGEFYWTIGWDESKVYAIATTEFKKQNEDMNNLSLFHAKIKEVLSGEYLAPTCPYCEDNEE